MKKPGTGFTFMGWIFILLGLAFIIPPLANSQDLLSKINGDFDIADLYFIQHEDATLRLDITLGVVMVLSGINLLGIGKVIKLIDKNTEKAPLN
jgi:hypothetical protein